MLERSEDGAPIASTGAPTFCGFLWRTEISKTLVGQSSRERLIWSKEIDLVKAGVLCLELGLSHLGLAVGVLRSFHGLRESVVGEAERMGFLSRRGKTGDDRDFSARGCVSNRMGSAAIAISVEQAEQSQRENAAIASGLKVRDTALLDHLIELYQHRLLRYLMFLTGKREVAEDLFQETWMRVLVRGSQYNGKARFDTWLFAIARNLAIDLSRKRKVVSLDEISDPTEDGRGFEIVADGPSPLEQFEGSEDRAEIAAVLLNLEANYREVLTLRFHEEMSLEEIASVTRAPLSTVKSRLYRGLAALKPEIERLRALRNAVGVAG